tara:strand:+ start:17913 stop:20153 length:2241 start_codon:yes stop_codon:yes gene_type:complete
MNRDKYYPHNQASWVIKLLSMLMMTVLCAGLAWANGDELPSPVQGSKPVNKFDKPLDDTAPITQQMQNTKPATLEKVDFKTLPGGKIQMTLDFSRAVQAPKGFMTTEPARLILDFYGVENDLSPKDSQQDIDDAVVHNFAALQADDRTRLMLDLTEAATYKTQINGKQMVITLTGKVPTVERKRLLPKESFKSNNWVNAKHSLRGIDFRRDLGDGGQVVVNLSDASMGIDINQKGEKLYVDFINTAAPDHLRRKLDVTDFGTPVQSITTQQRGRNVHMVIAAKGPYEHLAYQIDKKFVVDVKALTPAQEEAARKKDVKYTGQRLSLNFQDIQVRAVLQLLAEFTGINIVASDTVKGSMTLRLNNVPWDEALDIILRTQGLDKRKVGSVLMIAPAEEIAAREKEDLASQKEIEELEPLRTELMQLNYAKAAEVSELLKGQDNTLLTSRGNVTVDARTNALLVQDTQQTLNNVRELIQKLDIPVKQVLIEARLVNVDTDFEQDLGIRFGITKPRHVSGTYTGANDMNLNVVNGLTNYAAASNVATDSRLNVNLPAAIDAVDNTPSIGVALAKLGKGYLLDLELSAIESEGGGEVISSPRLVTANEQEAYIEQGEEIPYQEATSSGATSVEFKKAVLALRVTPQITPDGKIIMKIKVNQDRRSTEPEVLGVPAIDTQQIETQVLVDNGQTIVLGGIYRQTKTHDVQRIPFLGELPVVGYLFRNTNKTEERRELLIFITPKIVKQTQFSA